MLMYPLKNLIPDIDTLKVCLKNPEVFTYIYTGKQRSINWYLFLSIQLDWNIFEGDIFAWLIMRDTHVHIYLLNLKIITIENGVSLPIHVRMIDENVFF